MNSNNVPVIAIDGPSASGKGTVAQRVAASLAFTISTAARSIVWWRWSQCARDVDLGDEKRLSEVATQLDVVFEETEIRLGSEDVSRCHSLGSLQ